MFFFFFSFKTYWKKVIYNKRTKTCHSSEVANAEAVSKRRYVTEAKSPIGFGMKFSDDGLTACVLVCLYVHMLSSPP